MLVRLRLFLSSYAPLFAVAAIRFESARLRIAFGTLALLGVLTLLLLIRTSSKGVAPRSATPTAVRNLGSEVSAYIATYLLPFIAVDHPRATDLAAYGLVFFVLAIVFVNSDLIGVNPVLYLLGYRIYSVDGVRVDSHGAEQEAVVISNRPVRSQQHLEIADLATGVSIVVHTTKGETK